MRYLSRNKVYEKLEVVKEAKKVYIFCEGADTEINYFKYFQGFSSNIDIIPIPNNNGKSDPSKLKENAELLFFGNESTTPTYQFSEDYKDEVWFVIDTDRWNEGNKINILRDCCTDKIRWFVVQSNPCFELWQYYHLNSEKPQLEDTSKFSSFKAYVNNQIKGGFNNRTMPIELESAVENSSNNFECECGQPKLHSTEVHILGKVILFFVKPQLDKAKQMLFSNKTP
ncbi:MAG: RloB family protein [Flectobacillus sp.]|nr:RloB family protein [Flectobacillus sp.]